MPTSAIAALTVASTSPWGSVPPLEQATASPPSSRQKASAICERPLLPTQAK
jgi:hypothetical protein